MDANGVGTVTERASARFAHSDSWSFNNPTDTWEIESACQVWEPTPDGWSWWDPVDVGAHVALTGPMAIDLPRSDPRPGIHVLSYEPGTIAPGDYRVSWEGGVADEANDIYALPAMEFDGLTFPPRLDLGETDLAPSAEMQPGIELRWEPSDVTNRLQLTLVIQDDCGSDGFRMTCRLADDGHFVFPAQVDELPVGAGTLTLRRETIRKHPVSDSEHVVLRGGSTVSRKVRNDVGRSCEDLWD